MHQLPEPLVTGHDRILEPDRLNVEINLRGIRDDEVRANLVSVLDIVEPMAARAAAVERVVREMLG